MIVPSGSGRRIARPCSGTPLPMPVFFRPQAIPADAAPRVGVLDGEERALEADAWAEQLAGRGAVSDVEGVAPADLPAVDARRARRAGRGTPSIAKFDWLTPKPRIAPQGGLFV